MSSTRRPAAAGPLRPVPTNHISGQANTALHSATAAAATTTTKHTLFAATGRRRETFHAHVAPPASAEDEMMDGQAWQAQSHYNQYQYQYQYQPKHEQQHHPHHNMTASNADTASVVSGLSSLEGDDSFERLMIQQERDQQQRLLAQHNPSSSSARVEATRPFRRARAQPRLGLTMENLERMEGVPGRGNGMDGARQARSPGSVASGSERSDPPVGLPREWGSKGRHRTDYLRRIRMETPTPSVHGERHRDPERRVSARGSEYAAQVDGGDVDWVDAAADVPMPSVEDAARGGLGRRTSPTKLDSRNAGEQGGDEWDISEDFSMHNVIASTPAVGRNAILEDIRQREMEVESENERATETHRLNRIPEVDSSRRSQSAGRAYPSPSKSKSPEIQIDTPATVYQHFHDAKPLGLTQRPPVRPNSRREDSRDLLRRLARASMSPSPKTSPQQQQQQQGGSNSSIRPDSGGVKLPSNSHTENIQSREKASTNQQASQAPYPPPSTLHPQEANASNPSGSSRTQTQSTVVEETILAAGAKTPVVTGAWIDTPAPISRTNDRLGDSAAKTGKEGKPTDGGTAEAGAGSANSEHSAPAIRKPEPNLPRSALDAVVAEAKKHDGDAAGPGADLGESTIDSLEDLLLGRVREEDDDEDSTTNLRLGEDTTTTTTTLHGLTVPAGAPRSEAEARRRREVQVLQGMSKRLREARTSILDARRGIRRVEREVEDGVVVAAGTTTMGKGMGVGQCERCGCPGTGGYGARLRRRLVWSVWDPNRRDNGRWGLTRFGLLLTLFAWWYCVERVLCYQYCHPLYGARMEGYGVDPDAPRMPFVTLTLAARPFRWLWRPAWAFCVWLLGTLSHWSGTDALVRTVGEVLGGAGAGAAASATRKVATHVLTYARATAAEAWEEDGGVWSFADDERI